MLRRPRCPSTPPQVNDLEELEADAFGVIDAEGAIAPGVIDEAAGDGDTGHLQLIVPGVDTVDLHGDLDAGGNALVVFATGWCFFPSR